MHLSRNIDSFLVIQDKLKFGGHLGFSTLIPAKTTNLFLTDTQFWIAIKVEKKWVSTNAWGLGGPRSNCFSIWTRNLFFCIYYHLPNNKNKSTEESSEVALCSVFDVYK